MKVSAGKFRKIYDPSIGESEKWYINDHAIIRADDGWHMFGITHSEPAAPLEEVLCAHAVSKDILNIPMKKQPYPFSADKAEGELHFWAPHIILHDELYYMYYCAGSLTGFHNYRIHLTTSTDLIHWTRHPECPLLVDGYQARDPMVIRVGSQWIMYYTCTTSPEGGNHCVACVRSNDLIHWTDKQIVFTSHIKGTIAGPCESPFVKEIGDAYYLFIGPYGGYDVSYCDTAVYRSTDPFCFTEADEVGRIPSHGSEVVDIDGELYITHCGWGQGGLYIAPLYFNE